jgi:type I restriction enzyme M protein
MSNPAALVQKLWNYCNILRDDGLSYGDYVDLIDKEQWSSLSADVKGDAYEGLLQKNAEDVKGGAGQYFTARSLTSAVVDVMTPRPGQTMCDPAGGTGGFVLATHDYLASHYALDRAQKKLLRSGTLFVVELVDSVARLCCMNLLLHGISETDVGPVSSSGGLEAALEEFATIAEDLKK